MIPYVQVPLECGGQTFDFQLHHREVPMGAVGKIEYYWMPTPALRKAGGVNLRTCIDYWWAETQQRGITDPDRLDQAQRNLVLAELYPAVAGDKGAQNAFADAFLRPPDRKADGRPSLLPTAEFQRLRAMALARDVSGIEREIESLFVGELPPESERPAYNLAFEVWMEHGTEALCKGGRYGLRGFLADDLLPLLRKYRRRGSEIRPRIFINMVSVEARVGFHTCYTNAWSKLTPWLMQHQGLDRTSARFLSLWHNQNSMEDGRDAFWGHILALHPLSERVMMQDHHRTVVGEWLRQAANDPLEEPVVARDAYWDLVATILAAGHEYVLLRDQANRARRTPDSTAVAAVDDSADAPGTAPTPIAEQFEEYARKQLLECPACSDRVSYVDHEVLEEDNERAVLLTYECVKCGERGTTFL